MNIFYRRELYITMDLMKLNAVINALNEEKIAFFYKTKSTINQHGRVESIGLNNKGMFLYYIYVHKKDLETARRLMKDF